MPQVDSLNRHWHKFPPMPVQLLRLSAYFGFAPEPEPTQTSQQQTEEQGAALLELFPIASMPKIMSAEEYLQQRESKKHG